MFGLFRKPKPKATPENLSEEIINLVKTDFEGIQEALTTFLKEHDEYKENENKIRNEIQWIPYVAGVLGVFMHSDAKYASRVIKHLAYIWETRFNDEVLPEDIHVIFKKRMDDYFTRFNRGMILRSQKGGEEIMKVLSDSLFDCANEGIYFFTDRSRQFEDTERILQLQLEDRQPWGMLELHVRETLMYCFSQYLKHFEKFNWRV